jgi:peptidoglycan/xylan/chitin deacetylase (PgdA/CDA1 family)
LLAVSVDLDETHLYRRIHGLEGGGPGREVFERALPRLVDWAEQRRLPLTWFVVGRDLQNADNADAVGRLSRRGDEIASHSFSHPYDLVRHSVQDMRGEIERSLELIARVAGETVRGFRAPGYVVSDTLLTLLQEAGLSYDSSVFPCPSYYVLKAAKLAAIAARGQTSSSILDVPEVLRAPTAPYRVGQPYWFRGSGILEIPVQVTKRVRLPFIGTALTMAGPSGARLLAHGVLGEPFVNLELHGIDALDVSDGLGALAAHQRDLRIPWHKKLDAIDAAVGVLRAKGYASVTMAELAARARAAS